MQSIEKQIIEVLKKSKQRNVFFMEDFRHLGSHEAVKVALHRMTKKKTLSRLARGIYAKPYYSKILKKEVLPGAEEVAKALAKRDMASIIPSGSQALHALGLSSQVPMNLIYYTDASPRKINLKNGQIIFKPTSSRNLHFKSHLAMLIVQALKEIGKENLTEEEESKIFDYLKNIELKHLKHDMKIAPQWIAEIMAKAIEH